MKRNLIVLTFIAVVIGCNESSKKEVQAADRANIDLTKADTDSIKQAGNWKAFEESFVLKNYLVSKIPSNDFITISQKAGIFISPDSVQIESLKKENGEEDFYTVADDNSYFEHEASEYLKEKKFRIVYPTKRYIKFISKNHEFYFDTKAKAARGWTAILFSPEKGAPKIINPADIDLEFQEYLK
ncbi:hypothetical protein [Rufibacter psychrotolerans]|uniref:hypothetical protein n=1 Tax=Rufibacter psychrotolerans TaxID=2812556 RepID=UPI0019684CAB|nr:hypothetical protein [Rufibacter sp. SYSU D00308]